MTCVRLIVVILCSIVLLSSFCIEGQEFSKPLNCKALVENWIHKVQSDAVVRGEQRMSRSLYPSPEERGSGRTPELQFFLHVPRTAGRTVNSCLLGPSVAPSSRCPPAYDRIRSLKSRTNKTCAYFTSHDDYSLMEAFPKDTAVVTTIRDPVDRLLSAYEFTLENAAKKVNWNETREEQTRQKMMEKDGVDTENVWPWKFLIPWMKRDLRARRDYRRKLHTVLPMPGGNVYDQPSMIMTLEEFIEAPEVAATIHNGQVLQILGMTSYHWRSATLPGDEVEGERAKMAQELMTCGYKGGPPAALLAEAAQRRLTTFRAVGLFDQLDDTVSLMAASLNISLQGPAYKGMNRTLAPKEDDEDNNSTTTSESGDGEGEQQGEGEKDEVPISQEEQQKVIEAARGDLRKAQGTLKRANYAHYSSMAEKKAATASLEVEVKKAQEVLDILEGKVATIVEEDPKPGRRKAQRQVSKAISKEAQMQAKWAALDRAHYLNQTLGENFVKCVERMKRSYKRSTGSGMQLLKWADGSLFEFSKETRAKIAPSIISKIRAANTADRILYDHVKRLFTIQKAQLAGRLEKIPETPPAPPSDADKNKAYKLPPEPEEPRPDTLPPLGPLPDIPKLPYRGIPITPWRPDGTRFAIYPNMLAKNKAWVQQTRGSKTHSQEAVTEPIEAASASNSTTTTSTNTTTDTNVSSPESFSSSSSSTSSIIPEDDASSISVISSFNASTQASPDHAASHHSDDSILLHSPIRSAPKEAETSGRKRRRKPSDHEESEEEALFRRWREVDIQEIQVRDKAERAAKGLDESVEEVAAETQQPDKSTQSQTKEEEPVQEEKPKVPRSSDPLAHAKNTMKGRLRETRQAQAESAAQHKAQQERIIAQAGRDLDAKVKGKNRAPAGPKIKSKTSWEHDEL